MSNEIREVKRRVRSTRQIRQVTRALQRVSTSRLIRERDALEQSRRYTERLQRVLRRVCRTEPLATQALMTPHDGGGVALVVFGGDRGLCGGVHTALIEGVEQYCREREAGQVKLLIVGRVVARRLARTGQAVERVFPQPTRRLAEKDLPAAGGTQDLDSIVEALVQPFLAGAYREVDALFFQFVNGYRQVRRVERLLPLVRDPGAAPAAEAGADAALTPVLEPDAASILERLAPALVRQRVREIILESAASEDAARQTAMARASDNAARILSELTITYSRLRQEGITGEMLDLARGSGKVG